MQAKKKKQNNSKKNWIISSFFSFFFQIQIESIEMVILKTIVQQNVKMPYLYIIYPIVYIAFISNLFLATRNG